MRRLLLAVSLALLLAASSARATWLPAGNPVCAVPGYQAELKALPLPSDLTSFRSMFLCWTDTRDTVALGSNIYFDIVDPLGSASHSPSGTPLVVAPGYQGAPVAAVTGTSSAPGVVVAWSDNRNGPLDVWAKSVFGSWPAGGVPVCTAPSEQRPVRIVGNSDGGATLAWLDSRSGAVAVYAQRLDGDGNPMWPVNGRLVRAASVQPDLLQMAVGPGGDAYVLWQEIRAGQWRAYLQRLESSSGAPAAGWPTDGLEIGNGTSYLQKLLSDGAGGVYVVVLGTNFAPHAHRIDGNGVNHAGWPTAGVPLTSSFSYVDDARAFGDGLVVAWTDDGGPFEQHYHLYMQRLLGDGTRPPGWGADGNVLSDALSSQAGAWLADGPALIAVYTGWTLGPQEDTYAMRLEDDGSPHPDWPVNGVKVGGGGGQQYAAGAVWDGVGGVMVPYTSQNSSQYEVDIYAQIVSPSGRVDVARSLAGGFLLSAPVPNPASREVGFELALPAGATVRAQVVDALGRRVRALDAAGGAARTLRWNLRDDAGRRVEPGVYFVRVRGGGSETSRTVIVRR